MNRRLRFIPQTFFFFFGGFSVCGTFCLEPCYITILPLIFVGILVFFFSLSDAVCLSVTVTKEGRGSDVWFSNTNSKRPSRF